MIPVPLSCFCSIDCNVTSEASPCALQHSACPLIWPRCTAPDVTCTARVVSTALHAARRSLCAARLPPITAAAHMTHAKRPVLLVDTDVGLDDLFALALLHSFAAVPRPGPGGLGARADATPHPLYQVKLVTTVHGVTSPPQSAIWVRQLLQTLGWQGVAVHGGAVEPRAGGQSLEAPKWIGDARRKIADVMARPEFGGAEAPATV